MMIESETRKLLPTLGEIKSTWLGFRPTLPDSLPVIGNSKNNNKIFYAFGHQHIGWTLAAITGKAIQYLVDRKKLNLVELYQTVENIELSGNKKCFCQL